MTSAIDSLIVCFKLKYQIKFLINHSPDYVSEVYQHISQSILWLISKDNQPLIIRLYYLRMGFYKGLWCWVPPARSRGVRRASEPIALIN